jgi:hypothetical protein
MNITSALPSSNQQPKLYLIGIPGRIGGASTKILHLLRLLRDDFAITVLLPDIRYFKDAKVRQVLGPFGVPYTLLKELPKQLEGVALGICDGDFFTAGRAREV